jgi:DNA-binding winged helix-turn-helix (wHTH) protein/tetratricopeptide (TPR) repeat protein
MDRLDPASSGSRQAGYRFGEFRLEADGTLLRGETPVPLDSRELAALLLLLAHRGQVITPLQFKRALWGDEPVAAEIVSNCLASLRMHLEPEDWIESIPKRGYRFTAEVQLLDAETILGSPRLAIIPFTAGFGVPEYLGSAIADEAGIRLAGAQPAPALILARDSIHALARRGLAPGQIGQRMNADLVLSGELRAVASRYRLRVEMIRVENGSPLWTEDLLVDRTQMAELVQDLVNRTMLRLSGLRLPGLRLPGSRVAGSGLSLAAAATPELDPAAQQREAYELFARGRYEWQTLERHRMQDAMQHLERAIELDPDLMEARVDLAHLCVAQVICGFVPPQAAAEIVRRAAGSTENLPPHAEAMLPALGWISFHVDRNLPAALKSFAHSAHLPHDARFTRARVLFALSRRRFGEAIELQREAIRLDPYSPWLQARLAWAYHLGGESSLSVQTTHAALERFPEQNGPELYGAMILAFNGEAAKALELANALARRVPYLDSATAIQAYALAVAGRADEARTILDRLQWLCRERYAMSTFSPAAYLALGEPDAALAELRAADSLRCPWFFQMLADPRLLTLRERPEFASMLGILTGMEAEAERNLLDE